MSALQAIPTPHGIEILNSELKNTVTQYRLIGALTHDAASNALHSFHTATIETSYYDENGVLTFILNLPIETHFDEYLHRIDVLDSQNQAVIECPTPKIALAKGIGGIVTLKAAISGQAGDVVFKHGEYLTETELLELHLVPIRQELRNFVGLIGEFHHAGSKLGWLDLRGGECSRTVDSILWEYANETELVVSQATKDANPMEYAMYYGDGDGSTTFTLPNHHLGHFTRGTPNGISHGTVQGDAIRNITGFFDRIYGQVNAPRVGALTGSGVASERYYVQPSSGIDSFLNIAFDASRVVPTAAENRPYTANLSIKIHRGWM